MNRIAIIAYLSIINIFIFSSCGNQFDIDISKTDDVSIKISRYEKALFEKPIDSLRIIKLQKDFPLFLGNTPIHPEQMQQLQDYVADPLLKDLYKKTMLVFPNLTTEEKNISLSFRHIQYYYPNFQYPKVYSYISGVQDPVFYQEQIIMISIDQYLGEQFDIYKKLGIPLYKQLSMQKKFFNKDILVSIAKSYIQAVSADATLLEQMIYEGKILYFVKSMSPDISNSVLFSQTPAHIKWLQNNESELWRYYIENELLYKSDYIAYNKFINEAPFTAILGDDSAPKTGIWLGYQIIQSYMLHTHISLTNMIKNHNAQDILQHSKYKPGKNY